MGETDIAGMYHLLGQIAKDVRENNQILNEHGRILKEHVRRLDVLQDSVNELRSSIQGHGIMLCDLEDRTRRIERYLELPPAAE